LQRIAACCSVLQCAALCCSALHCIAPYLDGICGEPTNSATSLRNLGLRTWGEEVGFRVWVFAQTANQQIVESFADVNRHSQKLSVESVDIINHVVK